MDLNLDGKVVIVTGASAGIGKAIMTLFAKEKCNLIVCSRNLSKLNRSVKRLITEYSNFKIYALRANVHTCEGAEEIIKFTLSKFNRIDILVNNSDGPIVGTNNFENISEFDWKNSFEGKLHGYIRMSQFVIPIMKAQKWGRIINIIGLSGKEPGLYNKMIAAGIINAALINFTKSIAKDLAQYNVLVNGINPGYISTQRFKKYLTNHSNIKGFTLKNVKQSILNDIPLHKVGQPEDVANLAVFLASERANYIDGATINIDGGLSLSAF